MLLDAKTNCNSTGRPHCARRNCVPTRYVQLSVCPCCTIYNFSSSHHPGLHMLCGGIPAPLRIRQTSTIALFNPGASPKYECQINALQFGIQHALPRHQVCICQFQSTCTDEHFDPSDQYTGPSSLATGGTVELFPRNYTSVSSEFFSRPQHLLTLLTSKVSLMGRWSPSLSSPLISYTLAVSYDARDISTSSTRVPIRHPQP